MPAWPARPGPAAPSIRGCSASLTAPTSGICFSAACPRSRGSAVHPQNPAIIYAGTQHGPYRSADRGEHWEKVELPDHGLPVWSILFHPHDPDMILVGCENCEIYRSDDAGEHWVRLPVSVRFPDITTGLGS